MSSKKKPATARTNGINPKKSKVSPESQSSEISRQEEVVKQAEEKLRVLKENQEKMRKEQPATVGDIERLQKLITMLELHIKRLEAEVRSKKDSGWKDTKIPCEPIHPWVPYNPLKPYWEELPTTVNQTLFTGTMGSGVANGESTVLKFNYFPKTYSCCLNVGDNSEPVFLIDLNGLVAYSD